MKAKLLGFIWCNILGGLCVLAPVNVMAADANHGELSSADYKFISEAVRGGTAEVELGQIAKDRAASQSVKDFADRMVKDHSQANQQLTHMAAQKHATLPAELSAPEKRETDRLLKLSGAEFDRAYMRYMVREHKADVKEFQHEATKASDPDVQSWAGKTLPTLQEHLRMAEDIDSNVNGAPTIK